MELSVIASLWRGRFLESFRCFDSTFSPPLSRAIVSFFTLHPRYTFNLIKRYITHEIYIMQHIKKLTFVSLRKNITRNDTHRRINILSRWMNEIHHPLNDARTLNTWPEAGGTTVRGIRRPDP